MRASSSFSARSLASATAPLSSSPAAPRARALTLVAAASSRKRQELQQPLSSIAAAATRVASSDDASTSSSSSPLPSSSALSSSSARNFAVLAAAVAGLAAFGGAAAPHAAAALIDAAGVDASASSSSTSMMLAASDLHLHASSSPLLSPSSVVGDLADSEDFWSNLLRYVSFYFSVLLGTAATAARPVAAALKRSPASAAGVVVAALVLGIFVTKTVGAMLGVDDGSPDDLTAFLNSNME